MSTPASRPLRVLMLSPTTYAGGTWFRVIRLARGLLRRGHDVTVVHVSPRQRFLPLRRDEDGVRVIEMPRLWGSWHGGTRAPTDIAGRVALLARERFDVVHTFAHQFNSLVPAVAARVLQRNGIVVTDWDDLWGGGLLGSRRPPWTVEGLNQRIVELSERWMYGAFDGATTCSEFLRDRLLALGSPAARVRVLVNGAPLGDIPEIPRTQARQQLNLPQDRPVLLFTGYGQYDVDMILGAYQVLRTLTPVPYTVLVGPNDTLLRDRVRAAGLQEHVRVDPAVKPEGVMPYLRAADVGLMPYSDTPFNRSRYPMKVGDYQAAHLPVATCRVGMMEVIVGRHGGGVLTEPEPVAFGRGIAGMLEPDTHARLVNEARAAARALAWDLVSRDLEEFYLERIAARALRA